MDLPIVASSDELRQCQDVLADGTAEIGKKMYCLIFENFFSKLSNILNFTSNHVHDLLINLNLDSICKLSLRKDHMRIDKIYHISKLKLSFQLIRTEAHKMFTHNRTSCECGTLPITLYNVFYTTLGRYLKNTVQLPLFPHQIFCYIFFCVNHLLQL